MTPEQKIKREILLRCADWIVNDYPECAAIVKPSMNEDAIQTAYDILVGDEAHYDPEYECRKGDMETDITPEWSRHHESKSVAMKCCDGTWVGWTYWYGGGKFGDPDSIEWMPYAYELECVTVRTWTKK